MIIIFQRTNFALVVDHVSLWDTLLARKAGGFFDPKENKFVLSQDVIFTEINFHLLKK